MGWFSHVRAGAGKENLIKLKILWLSEGIAKLITLYSRLNSTYLSSLFKNWVFMLTIHSFW
jgi:hypothetical protein